MRGQLIAREQLSRAQRAEMFHVLSENFEGVSHEQFNADLVGKNWVILIRDDDNTLCGFSTLHYYEAQRDGQPVNIVYSGDTIIAPTAWGTSTLPRTWIDSVWALHEQFGVGDLYWLIITSGFRTYRLICTFWEEFWPRHGRPTPPATRAWIDQIASGQFGDAYDAETGVVRFENPQVLRGWLLDIPDAKRSDPHVDFFVRANPGYVAGDELVSVVPLVASNLTAAGRRILIALQQRGGKSAVAGTGVQQAG